MIATILAAIALATSLAFNYLQYRWREEEREQHEQERAEAKAEQVRKERMPPEVYNANGTSNPIRITGSQHSVGESGPSVDVWGTITVVNPTKFHMKVSPHRLVVDGVERQGTRFMFQLITSPFEKYDRISLVGNDKQDYYLHFFFPEDKYPKGMLGDFWLTSSNRDEEPFSIPVSFS